MRLFRYQDEETPSEENRPDIYRSIYFTSITLFTPLLLISLISLISLLPFMPFLYSFYPDDLNPVTDHPSLSCIHHYHTSVSIPFSHFSQLHLDEEQQDDQVQRDGIKGHQIKSQGRG